MKKSRYQAYYKPEVELYVRKEVEKNPKGGVKQALEKACTYFELPYSRSAERTYQRKLKGTTAEKVVKRIEESDEFKAALSRSFDPTKKRFIITWAQIETALHQLFWQNLMAYAEFLDAGIHVIAGRYKNPNSLESSSAQKNKEKNTSYWPVEVRPYLDANRQQIHKYLSILSDVKVQPTAVKPLSGIEGFTGLESSILGHPKVHMRSLPILDGYPNKLMWTTGACTVENYTDTKVGKRGEFNHQIGFVVVEIDDSVGAFHVRQVQAVDSDGSFMDLCFSVRDGAVHNNTAPFPAMVLGDIHLGSENKEYLKLSLDMARKFKVSNVILHDVFDGKSINPHEEKDPFILLEKESSGKDNLEAELLQLYNFMEENEDLYKIVIRANHDDMLDRFLRNSDWRKVSNKKLYWRLGGIVARGLAPNGIIPYLLNSRYYDHVRALGYNDSCRILDWELGLHGNLGTNGSKGGINQFKSLNTKSVTAHCMPGRYQVNVKGKGWTELYSVKVGDIVLSFSPEEGRNVWQVVREKQEYDYDGLMLQINGNGFEQTFTTGHHLMMRNGDYIKASEAIVCRSASELPLTAEPALGGIPIPDDVVRMLVAIAADGSQDGYRIRFNIKKERKIERLKQLFGGYLKFHNTQPERGVTSCYISTRSEIYKDLLKYRKQLSYNKRLGPEILTWDSHALEVLVDELKFWDGTYDTSSNGQQFSTNNKSEANAISAALNILGYSARTHTKSGGRLFVITWCSDRSFNRVTSKLNHGSRMSSWGFNSFASKSKVFCLSVDTKCFWVRSKCGRVSLTGNSHTPAREDGALVVGTLTKRRLGYNQGLSGWFESNVLIYPNGKAHHINIVKGRYTTLY